MDLMIISLDTYGIQHQRAPIRVAYRELDIVEFQAFVFDPSIRSLLAEDAVNVAMGCYSGATNLLPSLP